VPEAFGESGWVFGVGYLLVNTVHTTLFVRASDAGTARAVLSLAPLNLASALLVFGGGFAPERYRYGLWGAALVLQIATPYLHRMGRYRLVAGHFVERHGLVVIVAIGESIVAVGLGFAGLTIDLGAITVAVLGLCIAYYLWWAYFAGDDERAAHALAGITDPLRRARLAVQGWGYAHYVMILAIVVLAAGVKKTVGHAFEPLPWGPAVALGSGVALYLLGHAWFLRFVHISGSVHRLAAAVVILGTIPLGHLVAVAQLAAIPLIMATAAIAEDLPAARRARSTALHTFGRTTPTRE